MIEWLSKILDRIFAVVGALLFIQFPVFMDQYVMHLAGRVDELQYQVLLMREAATQSGKTLKEFVAKFIENSDLDFSRQGELMQGMVQRLSSFSDSLASLLNANFLTRPFKFLFHLDWAVVKSTFSTYKIGLFLTFESLIYGLIGIVVGYYFYQVVHTLFQRIGNGFSRARKKEALK